MSDDTKTTDFPSGAQRSQNGENLDFTSLPLVGLIAVARTAKEGQTKYGRWNYLKGMPTWTFINRAMRHFVMHLLGDRSEPHLSHAAWNAMAACQSEILHADINALHDLGPGATFTADVDAFLQAGKAFRQRQRESGEFDHLGEWKLEEVPEIKTILEQRKAHD